MAGGQIASVEPLSGIMVLAAIGAASVGSLFASDAWYTVTFTGGEVKNRKQEHSPGPGPRGRHRRRPLFAGEHRLRARAARSRQPGRGRRARPGHPVRQFDRVGTAADGIIFGGPAAGMMAVLIMICDLRLQQRADPVRGPGLLRDGQRRPVLQGDRGREPEGRARHGARPPGGLGLASCASAGATGTCWIT